VDSHEISTIWTVVAALLAAAASWGGSKHAIGSLKTDMDEQKKAIKMIQEELKSAVSFKFCRTQRIDCKEERKSMYDSIGDRFDELIARIDTQDQKRHDNSNKTQVLYSELLMKLTALETTITERSRRFRKEDMDR